LLRIFQKQLKLPLEGDGAALKAYVASLDGIKKKVKLTLAFYVCFYVYAIREVCSSDLL
jgi:hypothetical protein